MRNCLAQTSLAADQPLHRADAARCGPASRLAAAVGGWVVAAALILGAGCASAPPGQDAVRTTTRADTVHDSTPIGAQIAELAAQHPGQSGFQLIRFGREAFTARIALADMAVRTLDVQYFLWDSDATGRRLADRLLRAADRGVRVRVLVDDVNMKGRDVALATLDAHPNVEIRLFNPFASRSSHLLGFLTDFDRVNHRMHNKLMVMDNAVAIVGGRNMADTYFEVDPTSNFRDLDVAAVGPIVRDLSGLFDRFWNGTWAVPIAALVDRPYTQDDLRALVARMRQAIANDSYPHPLDQDAGAMRTNVLAIARRAVWATSRVVFDDPASIQDASLRVMNKLLVQRASLLQREVYVEAAYFIPRDRGVALLASLVQRGVKVRVLTNSLASNDVIAAFAGYAGRREAVLRAGVELYELRPEPGPVRKRLLGTGGRSGLHTKAIVFDRKDVFIGSFNLDPRSSSINTEAGLYIESPALAEQVIAHMNTGVDLDNCYRVHLDGDGRMHWTTEDDGVQVRLNTDPMSTWSQRMKARFIRLLPIESQL